MTQTGQQNFGTALADFDAAPDADKLETVVQVHSLEVGATADKGWAQGLALLAAIDRHLDPGWDAGDVPMTAAVPPRAADGTQGFAGVAPQEIKDPQARGLYEREIAEQRAHAERYRLQQGLRRALADTLPDLAALAAVATAAERSAFAATLDAAPLSDARRQEVRALLKGSR